MTKGKNTRYFSKLIDGEPVTMAARTEADAVRYVYDGWRDITADVAAAQEAARQVAAAGTKPDAPAKR